MLFPGKEVESIVQKLNKDFIEIEEHKIISGINKY